MSQKSRQAYAISMKDSYFPAAGTEVFYVATSDNQPSHALAAMRRGWYHQPRWPGHRPHGCAVGPFKTAERAEDDIFEG